MCLIIKFDFNYICIMHSFSHFVLHALFYIDFHTFICMFILYTFVFVLIIITSHCLCNVCICCLAIYLLMNSLYCIQLSHLIAIFDIYHHYLWDLSYIHIMSIIWYSLLLFTLIHTWHILDVSIWLSFSWSAHFDKIYISKFSTLMLTLRNEKTARKIFKH